MSNTGARIPKDGDRIAVFGRPGSGKTTIAVKSLVRDVNRDGRNVLVFDPTGDILRYLTEGSAAGKGPAHVVDAQKVRVVKTAREALDYAGKRGGLLSSVKLHSVFVLLARNEMVARAAQFREAVNSDATRGWCLLADEAELVYGNRGVDVEDALAGLKLVRNRRQRLYLVGQRPQWLSALARSNSTHVCLFAADSRQFVEQGTREWGDPEDFDECYDLEQFEYLYRGDYAKPPYPLKHALKDAIPWS